MEGKRVAADTVDDYIAQQPESVRETLRQIRATIRETVPDAEERISYGIPGYYQHGQVIFFGAFPKHISIYPAPSGVPEFADDLARYQKGKGTFQFPLGEPIPYDLIVRLAQYRLAENMKKKKKKSQRRKQDEDRES